MSEDFKWNDELVLEFARFTNELSRIYQGRYSDLEDFKRAKQKAKQKLFTTEDGKDIYEGDLAFYIEEKNNFMIVSHSGISEKRPYKYFSTEAAAKNYIGLYKPCLSLSDIVSAWGDDVGEPKDYCGRSPLFSRLTHLINEKLNDSNR